LEADDEDRVEWAPARMNGQEEVALRNESPQLSAQLFAPEDVPKAAVNLICLAGDVAGRKTISEIANRRKRRRGKIALSCIFRMRIESYAPSPAVHNPDNETAPESASPLFIFP